MATPYGIDMGNVLNSKMASDRFKMQKQEFAQGQEDRAAARSRNALLQGVRGQAVQGVPGAMEQLVTLDPQQADQIMKYMKSADEKKQEEIKEMNDRAGRMAAVVLSSDKPEQAYQLYRNSVPESARSQMPEQFDEDFMKFQLARAREIDDLLENPEIKTFGGEDVMFQGGREVARTASENALQRQQPEEYTLSPGSVRIRGDQTIADNPRSPTEAGMNSSDESLMFRQSVELLGGLFDQMGNVQALDPTLRAKAQSIATQATALYRQGGMTRSEAVAKAAQNMGVAIPGMTPQGGSAGGNVVNWNDL